MIYREMMLTNTFTLVFTPFRTCSLSDFLFLQTTQQTPHFLQTTALVRNDESAKKYVEIHHKPLQTARTNMSFHNDEVKPQEQQ